MGEINTVVSAYTTYRHLKQHCSHPSISGKIVLCRVDCETFLTGLKVMPQPSVNKFHTFFFLILETYFYMIHITVMFPLPPTPTTTNNKKYPSMDRSGANSFCPVCP